MSGFLADPQAAAGPLWNGYVVMLHATACAAGIAAVMPLLRRSARAQAAACAAAIAAMLAVTVLCWMPGLWWAPWLPRTLAAPMLWIGSSAVGAGEGVASPSATAIALLYTTWIAGSAAVLLRAAAAYAMLHVVTRRAEPACGAEWRATIREACSTMGVSQAIDVRIADSVASPMTWGALDPVVLLPGDARGWDAEQRRMVLLHELAHVRRGDAAVQLVAQLAFAWYWFHPGVWWLASRLRAARERAADALVIAAGVRRSEYAAVLVAMADRVAATGAMPPPGAAIALTGGHAVTRRVKAVLEPGAERRGGPWSSRLAMAACAACIVWTVAVGTVRLSPQRRVVHETLRAGDWTSRAYAVQLFSRSRSADVRAALSERASIDPNPAVRRIARQALTSTR